MKRFATGTVVCVALVVLCLSTGCAMLKTGNPYAEEIALMVKDVDTVLVMSTSIPTQLGGANPQAERWLDTAISRNLTEAGFEVIPNREFKQLWKKEKKTVGDMFDPYTGKLVNDNISNIAAKVFAELKGKYDFKAKVSFQLFVEKIRWTGGVAKWRGRKIPVAPTTHLMEQYRGRYGTINALSVQIRIWSDTEVYYTGTGGIELLGRFRTSGYEPYPAAERLSDKRNVDTAVDTALKAFVEECKKVRSAIQL